MRAVIQRVTQASVTVDGQVVSSIGRGILCLIGISTTDTAYESTWLASKLLGLKVFPEDKDGEVWGWKNSVVEAGYEVLCVSQFTLYANLRKGSKPDFHGAKGGDDARQMYHDFLEDLRTKYQADKIFDGKFGAMMDVQLTNDGPVTLILDSATDAPAPPKAKTPLTAEQKERAKAKVAARQDRAKQRTNGSKAPADAAALNDAAVSSGVTALSEDRLISEAEEKSRELAESFKIAMTESYP
ncbi:d-tyrosyl-tRNA deacylase 1-like protein [Rhodotorula sp. JG-1b]|nr:d-tyrosyl-tRNA deacylase 1-like protein [Rhodotorula sp. JG-1b]